MNLFRRYIFPLVMGLFQVTAMLSILFVSRRLAFFIVSGVWLILFSLIHWHIAKVRRTWPSELPLAILLYVGIFGLVLLAEENYMRGFLIVLSGFMAGFLAHRIVTRDRGESSPHNIGMKPARRLTLVLWTIAVLSNSIFLFSVGVFFSQVPNWALALVIALLCGGAAVGVWRMYFVESGHRFMLWAMLIGVGMFECAWALTMLPLGYLVLGLILTWIWYLSVLFVRFHFGPQGIIWRRQGWFIVVNVVLLICLLTFFVRWI